MASNIVKVQGRNYRTVGGRIEAFREDHPLGAIITEIVEINHQEFYAVFRATIMTETGAILGTGTKKEDAKGFGDYIEKSEKGAVGRALVMAGYTSDGDEDQSAPPPRPQAPRPQQHNTPPQQQAPQPPQRPVQRPVPPSRANLSPAAPDDDFGV